MVHVLWYRLLCIVAASLRRTCHRPVRMAAGAQEDTVLQHDIGQISRQTFQALQAGKYISICVCQYDK